MLYFRFNTDNFVAPQQKCTATEFINGKPSSLPPIELCDIDFGQIQDFFFGKLINELSLIVCGTNNALYDVIDVPFDSFNINDEEIGKFSGVIKFALSEFEKQPINELEGKSLNDVGVTIEFCKGISNSEVNSKLQEYMQSNNLEYITESVMWKNMNDKEKIDTFIEYLAEIGAENKELIVVDPYIFNCLENEYCNMLAAILCKSKAKEIIIVTQKNNCKKVCCEQILKTVSNAKVRLSSDFHDRFWIAGRKAGFCTGTSLNGIGKKISLINMLCGDDVAEIIDELSRQSLLT